MAETEPGRARRALGAAAAGLVLLGAGACADGGTGPVGEGPGGGRCTVDPRFLVDTGIGRGGIASLDAPGLVDLAAEPAPDLMAPGTRVVAFMAAGRPYAVPLNVLWYHEIVNLDVEGEELAVTLCPLTGSSLVFDRSAVDGARLGVTGLLFKSNLVMFRKEGDPDSIWPQMAGEAACGPAAGTELGRHPAVEMRWAAWRRLHPETMLAVPRELEDGVPYTRNPYSDYGVTDDFGGGMPPLDRRRPVKERVLGLPPTGDDAGIALPYDALAAAEGTHAAVSVLYGGGEAVVLWSDEARGAMAFRPRTGGGRRVTIRSAEDGWVDQETRSRWTVDGRAVSGALAGARLEPVAAAYVAYWAPWAAFVPDTRLWEGGVS